MWSWISITPTHCSRTKRFCLQCNSPHLFITAAFQAERASLRARARRLFMAATRRVVVDSFSDKWCKRWKILLRRWNKSKRANPPYSKTKCSMFTQYMMVAIDISVQTVSSVPLIYRQQIVLSSVPSIPPLSKKQSESREDYKSVMQGRTWSIDDTPKNSYLYFFSGRGNPHHNRPQITMYRYTSIL